MAIIPGLDSNGRWESSVLEIGSSSPNDMGMIYNSVANISAKAKFFGDELNTIIADKDLQIDNPLVLAKITAMSGNYNMARQLQSNFMKALKDTDQAIIRNL